MSGGPRPRAALDRSAAASDEPYVPLYVVAAFVTRRQRLHVGALGDIALERGWYAYVGSARRGRMARVDRHFRRHKPLRWHADYLFVAHPPVHAWLIDAPEHTETVATAARPSARSAWGAASALADPARRVGGRLSAECLLADALCDAGGRRPGAGRTPGPDRRRTAAAAVEHGSPIAAAPTGRCGAQQGRGLRFGASDCRCPGHLLWFRDRWSLTRAVAAAADGLGASCTPYP